MGAHLGHVGLFVVVIVAVAIVASADNHMHVSANMHNGATRYLQKKIKIVFI